MPSTPAAPLLLSTRCNAVNMLLRSTTASINCVVPGPVTSSPAVAFDAPIGLPREFRSLLPPSDSGIFALSILGCAFPISMAYAILRHRLFDIRVMIRLGLRYTSAQGVLLSLVPVVGVVLAADLLIHGNQPLMQILGQRGLLYAVLAVGAFLLHLRRHVWLDALDRRFFREHYDAQRVLRAVVDEVRKARVFEKVASRVVSQIEAALHPEFASLLVRQPGEVVYGVMAASGKSAPPFPADSKLMTTSSPTRLIPG
jgi:hypothetical protein